MEQILIINIKCYVVFILISFFVVNTVTYASNQNLIYITKSDFENSKHIDEKNQSYYYIDKWFEILPDTSLYIYVPDYINSLDSHVSNKNIFISYTFTHIRDRYTYINAKIHENEHLSGIWMCRMYGNIYGRTVYIKVRVNDANPTQMMLVNRVALTTHKSYFKYHTAMYYYEDREMVDVTCISSDSRCTVQLKSNLDLKLLHERQPWNWGVGFQYKLQARNDNESILCTSKCSGYAYFESNLNVTIVLQPEHNQIYVKINDQKVYGSKLLTSNNITIYYINYAYFLNDNVLNITCYTNYRNRFNLGASYEHCNHIASPQINDKNITYLIKPQELSKITFSARYQGQVQEQVIIVFTPILSHDISPLTVNIAPNNTKLEYYTYKYKGMKTKYYSNKYNDSDVINMTCAKTGQSSSRTLNGAAQQYGQIKSYEGIIPKNNTTWSCILKEENVDKNIVGGIYVLFLLEGQETNGPTTILTPSSTTMTTYLTTTATTPTVVTSHTMTTPSATPISTTQKNSGRDWIPVVVGIVVTIILVCVITTIYKMKIMDCLKKKKTDENYDNLENDSNTIIPPYPSQWESDYAIPEGEMYDNSLYSREPLYTKPIPKNQRQACKPQTIYEEPHASDTNSKDNIHYATLNLKDQTPGNSKPIYANQKSSPAVYSQVLPKSLKKNKIYDNVSSDANYVNSTGSDYVEPTYSALSVMK